MDYKKLIESNFNIKVNSLLLMDSHFGTEIFLAENATNKFIIKKLPSYMTDVVNEGKVTEYLSDRGVKVSRFLKRNNGDCVLRHNDCFYTVQGYICGDKYALNSAPSWLLKSSAELLGKINIALHDYKNLPLHFGNDFFTKQNATRKLNEYKNEFDNIKFTCDSSVKKKWEEQIKHLEKICTFDIDTTKLTYANSHGDYNINQIIANKDNLTVIDWSSACKLPVSLEVITSYVFSSPKCKNGSIHHVELTEYIKNYTRYFKSTNYDIEMMPFVLYFWHTMCNYYPSENIADSYKLIANLISDFSNWLYNNVFILSQKLSEINNEM